MAPRTSAPIPTSHLHTGGVRTALFDWHDAARHGREKVLGPSNQPLKLLC